MNTGRDLHVDLPLSNVVIGYAPKGLIADQIAPVITVNKQSNAFSIFNSGDEFRTEDDKRAPGAEANVITRRMSSDTYYAENYALKDRIPFEDIKNADNVNLFLTRSRRSQFVKGKLMLGWEVRLANQVTSGSNVGSYAAVGSGWLGSGANPISDIHTAMDNVEDSTGYRPNKMVIGGVAWRALRNHSTILSRIYGTGQAKLDTARLVQRKDVAALFELDKILLGGAYNNTVEEGQAQSLSMIWADHCLLYYVPDGGLSDMDEPSFMYSFRWPAVANLDMTAEVHTSRKKKAEEVEVGYYQDEKITGANLAFLLQNCTSST